MSSDTRTLEVLTIPAKQFSLLFGCMKSNEVQEPGFTASFPPPLPYSVMYNYESDKEGQCQGCTCFQGAVRILCRVHCSVITVGAEHCWLRRVLYHLKIPSECSNRDRWSLRGPLYLQHTKTVVSASSFNPPAPLCYNIQCANLDMGNWGSVHTWCYGEPWYDFQSSAYKI